MNERNNGKNAKGNRGNKPNKADFAAKREEIIKKQKANLEMINDVADYLNTWVGHTSETFTDKMSMKEIISYLSDVKNYPTESTKVISQYNYLLMDLANAQHSKYIDGNRIAIRVIYIDERLKTTFRKELHSDIDDMFEKYSNLFFYKYDEECDAESSENVEEVVESEE